MRVGFITILLSAFLVCASLPCRTGARVMADQSVASPQDRQQRVRVTYQLTDVVVRDRAGDYVRGLGAKDFLLYIDGKEHEVLSADEYEAAAPGEERIRSVLELADGAAGEGEEFAPPVPPRFIILLFDRYNMGYQVAGETKEFAKRLVEKALLPHDRVAVFQYNGYMKALTGPTTDRVRIVDAIDAVDAMSSNFNYSPARAISSDLTELAHDFGQYIKAIALLGKAVAKFPGRKTMILFSEGPNVDYTASPIGGEMQDYVSHRTNYRLQKAYVTEQIAGLAKRLDADGIAVYTVRRGNVVPEWLREVGSSNILDSVERLDVLRTTSNLTKGKYIDAAVGDTEVFVELQEAVENYYVLGFRPNEVIEGRFQRIVVKAKDPSLRVIHRDSFYTGKTFAKMDKNERDIHLEEGFLAPGTIDDLGLRARGIGLSSNGVPAALVVFEFDAGRLGKRTVGEREVEMVINVEDTAGDIRYRCHKVFRSFEEDSAETVWMAWTVPLVPTGSRIFLAVRDNVTGNRATWREPFGTIDQESRSPKLCRPILSVDEAAGDLRSWLCENVKDGVDAKDPLDAPEFTVPGKPLADDAVEQGRYVLLVLPVVNLDPSQERGPVQPDIDIVLDPDEEPSYALTPRAEKAGIAVGGRELIISVELPLGWAQREEGEMGLAVNKVFAGNVMLIKIPYRITGFSRERASQLLSEPVITEIK
jgi:VWFA-related protein